MLHLKERETKSLTLTEPQLQIPLYKQGTESDEVESVDLDELRKAFGSINVIGEKRLDEIMTVIERFL